MKEPECGIDQLRRTVKLLDACNETFNQEWTAEQLLKIGVAMRACGWDIYPDQWTQQQVDAVLEHGTVPTFGGSDGEHALAVTDCRCSVCKKKRAEESSESEEPAS